MKTLKLALLATTLLASSAQADLYGGGHYSQFSDGDISLNGLGVTVGYEHSLTPKFDAIIEMKAGIGIKDESHQGVKVELDNYKIFSAKAKYRINSGFYALAILSRATIDLEADFQGQEVETSDNETGFGLGLGYDFETSRIDTELTYEKFDGFDIVTVNFKFDF